MYEKWGDVFKLAAKIAKELRAKDPKLSQPEATKKAWKDKRVIDAKAQFQAHKKKK